MLIERYGECGFATFSKCFYFSISNVEEYFRLLFLI